MRKNKLFFNISLVAFSVFFITGCDRNNENDKPQTFTISYKESDIYSISNLEESALPGETITFDVESTSVFYEISDVKMNGTSLESDLFGYSFEMPNENVEITVETTEITTYDDIDDNLSWGSDVDGKILALTDEELESGSEFTYEINLYFDNISSANLITSIDKVIYSSNENVIPTDAITFKPRKASQSEVIIGGSLVIDQTRIKVGTTSIYVSLDPNNSSLGTLIRQFEVIDPSSYVPETIDITFEFKNKTNYSNENIFMNVSDRTIDEIDSFYLKDLIDNKLEYQYKVGHIYNISLSYYEIDPETERPSNLIGLYINEWIGTNIGGVTNSIEETNTDKLYLLTVETPDITVPIEFYD